MVEQKRSSKNICRAQISVEQKYLSSKNGRAKIFGRAKTVEQKYLSSKNIGRAKIFVEQKYRSSKNICRANRCANRPAEASCRTVPWDAPCSKNIIKSMVYHLFFFARTILLMNLFTQFWLSGGRHFGSGLLAGLTAGRPTGGGSRGRHFGSPWGATRGTGRVSVGCHPGEGPGGG